ncbi:hypothetical protein CMV_022416 [Castanea mollissima]|uniref:Uncharacterized protein n=1 Tax=Castanea mollissima TaxID=60419 RepID=A0A8J4QRM5_9ROSI|nr:hypothetical protein CMV_022416 [Castanea mollissima]
MPTSLLSKNSTLTTKISPPPLQATSLVSFYASNANIVGPLPIIFGSLPSLQDLQLSYNNLNGTSPISFAGSGIQNLGLNHQQNGLLGSGIQNLRLNHQQNGLLGTIDVLSSMTSMCQVWLMKKQFAGPVPDLSKCTSFIRFMGKGKERNRTMEAEYKL